MKKLTYILLTLYTLLTIQTIYAQVSQEWAARYHFYSEDEASAITVDKAGNVYVTGRSEASTPNGAKPDYATIKYNPSGIQQWVQRYNGPGNDFDAASFIAVDDSGNVYVTGTSNRVSFPGLADYDIATIKYNSNGVQQWIRRYNGGSDEAATAGIVLDAQGNIYIGGRMAGAGYLIVKYNSNGDTLWARTYNNGGNGAAAMAVDSSGNVYFTGATPAPDWLTVKWNSQGVFQWAQIYNGPGGGADYSKSIAVSDSGKVYVTGYVWGNNNTDYATIKYDSSGDQDWVVFYNGGSIFTAHDQATSLALDDSGNAYVTGWSTNSNSSNIDYATIKYSFSGVQQWVSRFNGPANSSDNPCCVKLDTNGNVYVTGYSTVSLSPSNIDYCTIKYNNSGVQQWVIYYGVGPTQAPGDRATALAVDQSGNVYVTGYSFGDFATIKYSQTVGIEPISNEIPSEYKLYQNYPNPFNPMTNVKFQMPNEAFVKLIVFDVLGREIATLVNEELKAGTYEVHFDAANYSSGVYYYKFITKDFAGTKKIVLIK